MSSIPLTPRPRTLVNFGVRRQLHQRRVERRLARQPRDEAVVVVPAKKHTTMVKVIKLSHWGRLSRIGAFWAGFGIAGIGTQGATSWHANMYSR